jgi:hypothetical protein
VPGWMGLGITDAERDQHERKDREAEHENSEAPLFRAAALAPAGC